jgi:hypothetical protein
MTNVAFATFMLSVSGAALTLGLVAWRVYTGQPRDYLTSATHLAVFAVGWTAVTGHRNLFLTGYGLIVFVCVFRRVEQFEIRKARLAARRFNVDTRNIREGDLVRVIDTYDVEAVAVFTGRATRTHDDHTPGWWLGNEYFLSDFVLDPAEDGVVERHVTVLEPAAASIPAEPAITAGADR